MKKRQNTDKAEEIYAVQLALSRLLRHAFCTRSHDLLGSRLLTRPDNLHSWSDVKCGASLC